VKTISAVRSAGDTHPGLQREVNEDRFHVDVARGLFIVVDGVGGQAAGGKAADLAMRMLRARLERETGPVADRVREAITVANNEIRRVAALRPEWHGMACVLTVAVVEEGRAIVGHVGDTRLYKLRKGRIDKVTRDHSPVGEREDAHEISEVEAMRHPRRNEVYRDVGSEAHEPLDPDFIDLHEIPFEPDAALLLCSDGLTDLIDSTMISDVAAHFAGRPHDVVRALIQAANDAGGRDNVTVVYVEGEQFAASGHRAEPRMDTDGRASGVEVARTESKSEATGTSGGGKRRGSRQIARAALVVLLLLVAGYAALRLDWRNWRHWRSLFPPQTIATAPNAGGQIVVTPSESIAAALAISPPGGLVLVEPGEYRERLVLTSGVRIVSRVPRGATIRLPSTASEGDPAVVADRVLGAELVGFRIVGDAATPLGTGIFATKNADVSVVDVEITGAAKAAIDLSDAARLTLLASHIHDNPGSALTIRGGASPRVNHNVFSRNGLSERVGSALVVERDTLPTFFGNVFQGIAADAFRTLGDAAAARVARDNWFADGHESPSRPSSVPSGRRGR
jgi:serine/threonine protein phosphatase PrpC